MTIDVYTTTCITQLGRTKGFPSIKRSGCDHNCSNGIKASEHPAGHHTQWRGGEEIEVYLIIILSLFRYSYTVRSHEGANIGCHYTQIINFHSLKQCLTILILHNQISIEYLSYSIRTVKKLMSIIQQTSVIT